MSIGTAIYGGPASFDGVKRALSTLAVAAGLALPLAGCADDPFLDFLNPTASADGQAGSVPAMMRMAEASRAKGNYRLAAGMYRRAHALEPQSVEPLVKLGESLNDLRTGGTITGGTAASRAKVGNLVQS